MALIVTEGVPIPTAFEVEDTFNRAMQSPQINIQRLSQDQDAWCYAACADMVFAHCIPGVVVNQCDIAGFVKVTNCCSLPPSDTCIDSGCSKDQITDIFTKWGVNNLPVFGFIDFAHVKTEINANRPIEVVVDWKDTPGTSHAVLIAGFNNAQKRIYVIDPLSPPDYNGWWLHNEVVQGFMMGKWDRTWMDLKKV